MADRRLDPELPLDRQCLTYIRFRTRKLMRYLQLNDPKFYRCNANEAVKFLGFFLRKMEQANVNEHLGELLVEAERLRRAGGLRHRYRAWVIRRKVCAKLAAMSLDP